MAVVSLYPLWQDNGGVEGRWARQEHLCPQSRRHAEPGPTPINIIYKNLS